MYIISHTQPQRPSNSERKEVLAAMRQAVATLEAALARLDKPLEDPVEMLWFPLRVAWRSNGPQRASGCVSPRNGSSKTEEYHGPKITGSIT